MVFAGRYEAMRCPIPVSINSCLSWVPGSFALEMCVPCASHVDPALRTHLASSIPDMRGTETVSRPLLALSVRRNRSSFVRIASLLHNFAESREICDFVKFLFEHVVVFRVIRDFSQQGLRRNFPALRRNCPSTIEVFPARLPNACPAISERTCLR